MTCFSPIHFQSCGVFSGGGGLSYFRATSQTRDCRWTERDSNFRDPTARTYARGETRLARIAPAGHSGRVPGSKHLSEVVDSVVDLPGRRFEYRFLYGVQDGTGHTTTWGIATSAVIRTDLFVIEKFGCTT